jgi:hypothetical protein
MPRKQRFKPSRKPKPMPVTQTEEHSPFEQTSAQSGEIPGAPEYDPARSSRDRQRDPLPEEAEAQ